MRVAARAGAAIVAVVAILAAAVALWFWYAVYRDRSAPQTQTRVVVPQGATVGEVGRQLAGAGVIGNALAFRLLARLRGQESAVRAGEYRFAAHRTLDEVLRALVTGGAQVAVWVTIPEGYTTRQIAARLADAGVGSADDYARAFASDTIVLDGTRTKSMEGFLFPSTYLIPLGSSPAQVERQMSAEFFQQLPHDAALRAQRLHVSVPQAVTVASLVEREAKAEADRPLIASVVYNRLRLRMPLQIDATIEYALPQHKAALSYADLKIDSPFNTYTHAGLPPTPIANPGRPSLEAALHPANTAYLYYVYCGQGRHVFADSLAQHQANVARCLH